MNATKKILLAIFSCIIVLSGCQKQKAQEQDVAELSVNELNSKKQSATNSSSSKIKWTNTNKTIAVLFAYGFNDEEFYKQTVDALKSEYGLYKEGGIIHPIIFPQDLRGRILNLHSALEDLNLAGLILLGAPEKTHFALASLQDDFEGDTPFNVASLFPQDEILGQESCCDFVLEYDNNKEIDLNGEETNEAHSVQFIMNLLSPLINRMIFDDSKIVRDENFINNIKVLLGRNIKFYTDSETGLVSVNHFILEQK